MFSSASRRLSPKIVQFIAICCLLLPGSASAYKVLFVGNSFTGYAVSTLERFSRASPNGQDTLRYQWVGGLSLIEHSTRPQTLQAIRDGAFDYVVLQDFSRQPIEKPLEFQQGMAAMVALVRASGAEPILYMTWARLVNGNYPENQAIVSAAYVREAQKHNAALIRVGEVWRTLYQNDRELFNQLYDPDLIHPSIFGTFAITSSIYKVLYDNNQSWSPTTGLGDSATAIRAVALQLNQTRPPYRNTPPVVVPPEPPTPANKASTLPAILLLLDDR